MRDLQICNLLLVIFVVVLVAGCGSDGVHAGSSGDENSDANAVQMLPPELACAVFSSAVAADVDDSGHGLPIRVQRCSFMVEQEPGSPPTAIIIHAQGEETISESMVGDELQDERVPFDATFHLNVSPDDESTYVVGTGDDPGTVNVDLGTPVEGEITVDVFNLGAGSTLTVDLELSSLAAIAAVKNRKMLHGEFRAKLAEDRAKLECHPDNADSKTLEHRFICLGEGRRCAGSTLPCCTDECQDNDGDPIDPSDPLRCGSGGTCVSMKSSILPAYCPMAGTPPAGASCPGGAYYCGRSAGCCPPNTPYSCPTTGECFEVAEDADYACDGSDNICALCHPIAAPPPTGGPDTSGADCPCGPLSSAVTTACGPDPLAAACYCAQARVSDCLADNATGCMADAAKARADSQDLQRAAEEENGSCSL